MYFDALTLAAMTDELRSTIVGGRIQRVLLPTPLSIGLEVYNAGTRYQLYASADPRAARVHLLGAKPTRGSDRETPLTLLLRKYVRNGFVAAVEQPPLERILVLSIIKHPALRKEDPDDVDHELRSELILELMGNRANILLVDDNNLILDAVKRVPAGARRTIMPRQPYIAPAQLDRLDPRTATANGIRAALSGAERDVAKAIVSAYSGVSPQQAREALVRATAGEAIEPDADPPHEAIAAALRGLWSEPWEPSLAYQGEQVVAFAPYSLRQYAAARPAAGISEAVESYYAGAAQVTSHAQRRDALLRRLDEVRERYRRQFESLSRELERGSSLERLRWEGEMIFGFLHQIEPGQTELTIEGRTIRLDPLRTPVENAQARFREYDKAKAAVAGVPERLVSAENQLRFLDETMALLELAEGYEAIAAIEREATESGLLKAPSGKAPRGPRSQPLRIESSRRHSDLGRPLVRPERRSDVSSSPPRRSLAARARAAGSARGGAGRWAGAGSDARTGSRAGGILFSGTRINVGGCRGNAQAQRAQGRRGPARAGELPRRALAACRAPWAGIARLALTLPALDRTIHAVR